MTRDTRVLVNGVPFDVTVLERTRNSVRFVCEGRDYSVELAESVATGVVPSHGGGKPAPARQVSPRQAAASAVAGVQTVSAPLPGVVVDLTVAAGTEVRTGDLLLHLEAMKMHNAIVAPCDGKVIAVHVTPGTEVLDAQVLVEIRVPDGAPRDG